MSGSSVASDSMSSSFASSSRSGTTSPYGEYSPSSVSGSAGQWEHSRYASSLSPTSISESLPENLCDDEVAQIAAFYSGLFSEVFVCPAIASLYSLQAEVPRHPGIKAKSSWNLTIAEGVPVIVRQTRPDKKSLHIIFAERGTGFPLYQDVLTSASNYRTVEVDFHDFLTSNRQTLVGLRIFNATAAAKFLQHVISIVALDTTESDLRNRNKRSSPTKKKLIKPKKTTISPPCCFNHTAHIGKDDEYLSISQYVTSRKLSFT